MAARTSQESSMAQHQVVLTAVWDDATSRVTFTGMAPPPPPPASFTDDPRFWIGQTGPGFEVSFNVQPKNLTPAPTAIYLKTTPEGLVQRYLVTYVSGAWQMPGTLITE